MEGGLGPWPGSDRLSCSSFFTRCSDCCYRVSSFLLSFRLSLGSHASDEIIRRPLFKQSLENKKAT